MSATLSVVGSLSELGAALGLDGDAMEAYGAEDPHGGYPHEWPTGSLWKHEGRVLYALTRALHVQRALEIGTWRGCSATHIAQALHDAGSGTLDAVDIWQGAGDLIPAELRPYIHQIFADSFEYVAEAVENHVEYDLIYEDGEHSSESVRFIWQRARWLLKRPGGVIVSHDALHETAGPKIRAGIQEAGFTPIYVSVGGSDCGLAVWQWRAAV